MAGINQKLKMLYLAKILLDNTDEENGMTAAELISALAENDIEEERKTLYTDMEELERFGLDIQKGRSPDNKHTYFIGSRDFELAELKLLVDAVQSSKFITEKKTNALISKLETLTSKPQAKQLQRQVYVSNRIKTLNNSIYYNIDAIHAAISGNRQISFRYYQWTLNAAHAEKVLKRNGENYIISPFALTWDDENYYVVAYYEKYGGISNFRVDKMDAITILDKERDGKKLFKDFNIAEHTKKSFGMFSGEEIEVKLKFRMDNNLLGVVVDRFGKNIHISRPDEEHFSVAVKITESPTFWGWLFSFEDSIEIVSPEFLREKYKDKQRKTIEKNG